MTVNGLLAAAGVSFLAVFLLGPLFAVGILVGAAWIFLNAFALFFILESTTKKSSIDPKKISFMLMLKFPVIYLAGFFILRTHFFPVWALLTGISVFCAMILVSLVRFNFSALLEATDAA